MTRLARIAAGCAMAGLVLIVWAAAAGAQTPQFPRIGLSTSPDYHSEFISVAMDEPFDLHMLLLPPENGDPLFDVSMVRWAVFQVCCGGVASVEAVNYTTELEHEGHPFDGVTSVANDCITDEIVHLATITFTLHADNPGVYLMVAGPTDWAQECGGENVVLMDMVVLVDLYDPDDQTPVEQKSWGSVKATYR